MKKLFILAAILAAFGAEAATLNYKAIITVTSLPPVSATLDASGDTRRFTNNTPAVASKFIQTSNTLQAVASNVWFHANLYNFTNVNAAKIGSNNLALPTNTVYFEMVADQFVTFTALSNWCSIQYQTNSSGQAFVAVRTPHTNETLIVQTQVVNGVLEIIQDTNATNFVRANAPAFTNFPNSLRTLHVPITNLVLHAAKLTNASITATGGLLNGLTISNGSLGAVSGSSLLLTNVSPYDTNGVYTNVVRINVGLLVGTNVVFLSGVASNLTMTNIAWLNGYLGALTNGQLWNAQVTNAPFGVFTNLQIYGGGYATNIALDKPFLTNATIISATVTGSIFTVTGSGLGVWMTVDSTATTASLGPAISFTRSDGGSTNFAEVNDVLMHLVASGYGDTGLKPSARIRAFATTNFTDGNAPSVIVIETTSVGATTTTPRFYIGEDLVAVTNAPFSARAGITNQVHQGTNVWYGDISEPPTNFTSLATGNNIGIVLGTNASVILSGGVSGAVLCGVAGGRTGLRYHIRNDLGAALTLTENTVDPVAANRFDFLDGADVSIPNGGEFDIRYNATTLRWNISSAYPLSQVTTVTTNATLDKITLNPLGDQAYSRGVFYYNTNCDCPKFKSAEDQVELDIGQESWVRVVNNSGFTITNGTPVYYNGGTSNLVGQNFSTVDIASSTNVVQSRIAGIATMTITNGKIGVITIGGNVNGLYTTNGITNGSALYLSQTIRGGVESITNVPPTNGIIVRMGTMVSSNNGAGVIRIQGSALLDTIGTASLDFPSTAAAAASDLPITVTDCTSNSIVTGLNVPWMCATNGGGSGGTFSTFTSNGTVYVRFVNQTAAAINPVPGVFRVLVKVQF